MKMEAYYVFCPAEKKLMKPTGGMQTGKQKDAGRPAVVTKEQHLIKKKKPVGKT